MRPASAGREINTGLGEADPPALRFPKDVCRKDGLVLNGGNATGTPGGVDQVEGSLICDAGKADQTIFTSTPVPLTYGLESHQKQQ
jgi:hypothetical protein